MRVAPCRAGSNAHVPFRLTSSRSQSTSPVRSRARSGSSSRSLANCRTGSSMRYLLEPSASVLLTTRDWSTRWSCAGPTVAASSGGPPQMPAAWSRNHPSRNTLSRWSNTCSSGPSRSWDQASADRSVSWRGSPCTTVARSTSMPAEIAPSISRSDRWRVRAAASSRASGIPSSRRQRSISASRSAESTVRPASRTRSSRSTTEAHTGPARGSPGPGTGSGASSKTDSPGRWSGSRDVARIRSSGAAVRTPATKAAASESTCSQLSITSRVRPTRTRPTAAAGSAPPGSIPSLDATCSPTCRSPPASSRLTNHTPSGYLSRESAATCSAVRVLPMPPGPQIVTTRREASRRGISASSRSLPTKLPTVPGRLCANALRVRSGGKSRGSHDARI